jgi:GMP reductase
MLTAFTKHYDIDDYVNYGIDKLDKEYFMISTGISDTDFDKLVKIQSQVDAKWICIDVANGYMATLVKFCKKIREQFPNKIIIAGNVASREITEELVIGGLVDIVKVGIGPGSACLTRRKTGVGIPQLSAIIESADAAHGLDAFIIGDGGIVSPGDMAKAFGGGADFVMAGGIFAGHDENPGDIIFRNGKQYKTFYGMSSSHAMVQHNGSVPTYRSSEGRVLEIPYKGSLNTTVLDYLGGLRSTCTYINARTIKNIPKCCTFVLVHNQLNQVFES